MPTMANAADVSTSPCSEDGFKGWGLDTKFAARDGWKLMINARAYKDNEIKDLYRALPRDNRQSLSVE